VARVSAASSAVKAVVASKARLIGAGLGALGGNLIGGANDGSNYRDDRRDGYRRY
jgi:hypothetical protein